MGAKNLEIVGELMSGEPHFDAASSLFIDQQLEAMEAAAYRVEYQDLKMRQLLPLKTDVPAGAETFAYRILDVFGRADFISNYASELPEAGVRGEKRVGKVEGIANAYSYSTQDLRAAAMANVGLDAEISQGAMRAHEERVDETAASGDTGLGFVGFFKHTDVTIMASTLDWDSASGVQMLGDLRRMESKVSEQTKGKHLPTTIVLPMNKYNQAADKPVDTAGSVQDTVLTVFLRGAKYVREVVWNDRLLTLSATGAERAMCYSKDPRVCQLVIPMEPQQGEPEKRGLRWVRPIESRFGGAIVRQPLAIVYMDGI
jgi:hypothetical protein